MIKKKKIRVVAGLCEKDSRVLVQQRPAGKDRELLWEFPGGKVEVGESDAQALERECFEELNIQIQAGEELWQTTHEYEDLIVQLVLLRASATQHQQIKALAAAEVRWVDRSRLAELPFCEADIDLVTKLAKGEI